VSSTERSQNTPGYTVRELLHEDEVTTVSRAVELRTGRAVVLKSRRSASPTARQLMRLRHEFAVLSELADLKVAPNALRLEELDETLTLVIDDIEGVPLSSWVQTGSPDTGAALAAACALTAALQDVHQCGFVHGDLKPSNVLVAPGATAFYLIDFELATRADAEPAGLGVKSRIEGSLPYIAPERTGRTGAGIDFRSDYYSLGVTLYQLLSGQLPFSATDQLGWVQAHVTRTPRHLSESAPNVPVTVAEIVMTLLSKAPEDRYQSGKGLLADLLECVRQFDQSGAISGFELRRNDAHPRFALPAGLYGRDSHLAQLMDSFATVERAGGSMSVMVRGHSGAGKSRLVDELLRRIRSRAGFVIRGKFDQYNPDLPFAPVAAALRGLAQQILAQNDEDVERWRLLILEAVGVFGAVVTDLVPLFERIIGHQPQLPEVPPEQAQNRAYMVFRQFLSVFCAPGRPLVFFLDDLQWLDDGTRGLVRYLLAHPETGNLLLIGAYRDDEVHAGHPLSELTGEIREVQVTALTDQDLTEILSDALLRDQSEVAALARLLADKTLGNPFFAYQFLNALQRDELIRFDQARGYWVWSHDAIESREFADNVADLMSAELEDLAASTREMLALAGCLGNTFSISTLALVSGVQRVEAQHSLDVAVDRGLLVRDDGDELVSRFVHDRVQEAAYGLTPIEARAGLHARIGQAMMSQFDALERDDAVFEIASHLNAGAAAITDPSARIDSARVCLQAANRAKATNAYRAAADFAAVGIRFLPEDGFEVEPQLARRLHLQAAECAYLAGQFAVVDHYLKAVLARSVAPVDRAEAYLIQVLALVADGRNEEALEVGDIACRSLGLELTRAPTREDIEGAYREIDELLDGRGVEHILELPMMTDPVQRLALRILASLSTAAIFTSQQLLSFHDAQMVILSLKHGNDDFSVMAYTYYGFMRANVEDQYEEGLAYCRVANELMEQLGATRFAGDQVYISALTTLWLRPVNEAIEMARTAVPLAIENGNLMMAALARRFSSLWMLFRGDTLEQVSDALGSSSFANDAYPVVAAWNRSTEDAVLRLTDGLDRRQDDVADAGMRAVLDQPAIVAARLLSHLAVDVVLGEMQSARAALREAEPLMWSIPGLMPNYELYYSGSIAIAARYGPGRPPGADDWERLERHLAKLTVWAAHSPTSFEHARRLVDAECARLKGDTEHALGAYEAAIDIARRHGQTQHEALASERLAEYCRALGLQGAADGYLTRATAAYRRWGATSKVAQLETRFPWLRSRGDLDQTGTSSTATAQLDALAVVKASRAVSGEIVVERLLTTLMEVVLEHTMASRGALLLLDGNELTLRAAADAQTRTVSIIGQQHSEGGSERWPLPESILNFVRHSNSTLQLDDTTEPHAFEQDPYMVSEQPRSVLCIPIIHQGRLGGVLYLEHREFARVFVGAQKAVLEQIAAQVAVSLENANLYARLAAHNRDLETNVAERTAELEALHRELQAQADQRFQSLVDATAQVAWTTDPSGNFTRISGLATLLGPNPPEPETVSEWYAQVVHPDDRVRVRTESLAARAVARPIAIEYRVITASGTVRDVLARAIPVFAPGGTVREWVGVLLDISETRALEERVNESNKLEAVGQLAEGVAHDFNNLLTVIMQCGELLYDDLSDVPGAQRMLSVLLDAANGGADLTNQLLTFSRRQVVAPTIVDVDAVLRSAIAMVERLIPDDVSIRTELSAGLPPVTAAAGELDQVIMNLAVNARDAMPDGGTLTIRSAELRLPEGDSRRTPGAAHDIHVLLEVSDTGHGMDRATQDRMFEPFFTTKHGRDGNGLGLSIVYGVVQRVGGRVEVHTQPDVGTQFSVYLPSTADVQSYASTPTTDDASRQETILVVEDQPAVREFTVRMLDDAGYRVLAATDATQALELVAAGHEPIDLLFTDVALPGMSGGELAQQLVELIPGLRVLYTSGYNDDEVVRRGVRAAEVRLLAKPYTRKLLCETVRSVLGGAGG
jgi:PAS domain S-box-containing protein